MGKEGLAVEAHCSSTGPAIAKGKLNMCAQAFTRLLQYLVSEIPMSFLCLSVTDMSAWFHLTAQQGMTAICE